MADDATPALPRGANSSQHLARRGPTGILVTRALWLGVVAGLIEAVIPLVQKFAFGRLRIYASPDLLWMAPLADALLFLGAGLALAVLVKLIPAPRRGAAVAAATAVLGGLAGWAVTLRYPQLYGWAAGLLSAGVGVQVARSGAGFDRLVSRSLLPVVGTVALLAATMLLVPRWLESRRLAALPSARDGAPNILLLILDTVRAESLGLHGGVRPTSPRLDAFAVEGLTFANAHSTAPWTVPSHASMFTGQYPHELTADWLTPLDDSSATVAEVLARHGYATAGFTANHMVSWETGLSRGFGHYEDYRVSVAQLAVSSSIARAVAYWPRLRRLLGRYDTVNRLRAPAMNAALLQWLDPDPERPFFAFVNYMDAHEMYNPPAPFRGSFGPDTARRNDMTRYGLGGLAYRMWKARMTPSQVAAELAAYEESIAYLDHHLGILFDSLQARGVLDRTVVIVTSDHGEQFGEHGRFEHANSLYPQLLHVPLVMRGPGLVPAGGRISEFVTLRDLAATLLALGPRVDDLPGRSLSRFWDSAGVGTDRPESPVLGSATNSGWTAQADSGLRRGMRSVVLDGLQVIEDVKTPPSFMLFDLRADPRAERDLAADTGRAGILGRAAVFLAPVIWRSQAPGVARRAGDIGAPQH